MASSFVSSAWLIPLYPLAAFLMILALGRRAPGEGAYVGIAGIGLALLHSLGVFATTWGEAEGSQINPYHSTFLWATVGTSGLKMGFLVDHLTVMMLLVVTIVATAVQVYSVGYMHGDPKYPRFFAYLSLFSAAMLGLVVADNFLLLLISWELVGLCSYLLIGFWYERPSAMRAAKKAFIVTRLGDMGFLFGVVYLYACTGTLQYDEVFSQIGRALPVTTAMVIALMLFAGAVGKSAQFPLHVWLPDAMEGPTPVSALIHAATMVAAGVYLVGRVYPLFQGGLEGGHQVAAVHSLVPEGGVLTGYLPFVGRFSYTPLEVVAWIGGITLFIAAMIAVVQTDIKRILAYSTISQLGYMMMGLGVGGYVAGLFHLFTHAFFKALLFLGSGSVIHTMHTNEIWEMGGLRRYMPKTYWTFLIGTLALAGIFPFAGFWSKDEILLDAFKHNFPLYLLGTLGAFLTAFYMFRLVIVTFHGELRNHQAHPHESPSVMTIPLWVLATLSVVAGFWALNGQFTHYLRPGEEFSGVDLRVAGISTAVALLGILVAFAMYQWRVFSPASLIRALPWLYHFLKRKMLFDELYWAILVVPMFGVSQVFRWVDNNVVDGLVNAVGWFTVVFSRLQRWVDTWIVDGLVNLIGEVTKISGRTVRLLQTGRVQNYLLIIFIGVAFLIWLSFNYGL